MSFLKQPWIRQLVAGMMQAQQNACSGQTLSNKVRILIREKENRPDLSGAEVLNQVYVKSGCTLTTDGS